MANHLHTGDLPDGLDFGDTVAVDTETMGLNPLRDRLCVVQLSAGDGDGHVVHFPEPRYSAPNVTRLLSDPTVTKLFHFARFDIAVLRHYLGAPCTPCYCTKVASKLARTFTDRHSLKDLCRELLGVELSKQQQSSDWGATRLSQAQVDYAAGDVLYLHRIAAELDRMLGRENRAELAQACFEFLPVRARLDLAGWPEVDIFAH